MKLKLTPKWREIKTKLKYKEYLSAWRYLWNGSIDFDTGHGRKFWTFKKGEQWDYTNAQLVFPPLKIYEDGYVGFGLVPVKQEGAPIAYDPDNPHWEGHKYLGKWWSVEFKCSHIRIRFRYRSWTKNIFYIVWE